MTEDMFEACREPFTGALSRKKDAQLIDELEGCFHQKLAGVTGGCVRRLDGRVRSMPVDRGLGRWTEGLQDGRGPLDRFYLAVPH